MSKQKRLSRNKLFKKFLFNALLAFYLIAAFLIIIIAFYKDTEIITVGFAVILYTLMNLYIKNSNYNDDQKTIDENMTDAGLISLMSAYILYKLFFMETNLFTTKAGESTFQGILFLIITIVSFGLINIILISKHNQKKHDKNSK